MIVRYAAVLLAALVCICPAPCSAMQDSAAELRPRAERGDAASQYQLAGLYYSGKGVAKDMSEAARWFRKAAEQGHAEAQFYMGILCEDGAGTAKNPAEAAGWWRKAAEQGLSGAQFNLGRLYFTGAGVAENRAEAAKWFLKAAEQGDTNSQVNISTLYAQGMGIPVNEAEGLAWMMVAATSGNDTAVNYLPRMQNGYSPQVVQAAKTRSNEILHRIQAVKAARPDYVAPQSLQDAAKAGDVESLKALLAKGADINAKDGDGITALVWAAIRSQPAAADLLLANGATVDAATSDSSTALLFAARSGETDIVRALLRKGADVNARNSSGITALQLAAKGSLADPVRALLEGGADPNPADDAGYTPMYYAAASGNLAIATQLLARHADVNATLKTQQPPRTPLLVAGWNKHTDMVDLLLKNGARDTWLSGIPGFDPRDVGALVLTEGKDGTVMVGDIPFILARHLAARPWRSPGQIAARVGGNNLFRWSEKPNGDGVAGLIAIQDERGNGSMAEIQVPGFIGEGGIIFTDGVSSVAAGGPFADIRTAWVAGGSVTLLRQGTTLNLPMDAAGQVRYVLKNVTGNEPLTLVFRSAAGTEALRVDFDCVIRGAIENAARFLVFTSKH
jgi:TPR repeat protein